MGRTAREGLYVFYGPPAFSCLRYCVGNNSNLLVNRVMASGGDAWKTSKTEKKTATATTECRGVTDWDGGMSAGCKPRV